MTLKSGTRGCL